MTVKGFSPPVRNPILRRGILVFRSSRRAVAWKDMQMSDTTKPQDLLRCRSVVEFAAVQYDPYRDAVGFAFDSSAMLLQMTPQTPGDAMWLLEARGREASPA